MFRMIEIQPTVYLFYFYGRRCQTGRRVPWFQKILWNFWQERRRSSEARKRNGWTHLVWISYFSWHFLPVNPLTLKRQSSTPFANHTPFRLFFINILKWWSNCHQVRIAEIPSSTRGPKAKSSWWWAGWMAFGQATTNNNSSLQQPVKHGCALVRVVHADWQTTVCTPGR